MSARVQFKFRLYVTGDAPNSVLAISNLTAFCREHLPERHQIEIVDVLREPDRALADGILLTPTLVRCTPTPRRTVIGNLSQPQPLLQLLGPSA